MMVRTDLWRCRLARASDASGGDILRKWMAGAVLLGLSGCGVGATVGGVAGSVVGGTVDLVLRADTAPLIVEDLR